MECGLRFYFAHILELEEENTLLMDDMLQNNVIGTVVHYVLEKAVEQGRFKELSRQEIESAVCQYMCSEIHLTENDLLYDKNHLVYRIIVKYIEMYLQNMRSVQDDFLIEQTEQELKIQLLVDETIPITLKGIIDRVDNCKGQKRIVDYKTGSMKDKELIVDKVKDMFDGEHGKALQLMFYVYLYYIHYEQTDMEAEIVSLRKISQNYTLMIDGISTLSKEMMMEFEQLLKETVEEILNPHTLFLQTENIDHCKYCAFKDICRK